MPADKPTILATSGGLRPGRRTRLEFSALTEYAVELSGLTGRPPRVCIVATALGDNPAVLHQLYEAAGVSGFRASHLSLFPMPNVGDVTAHLLAQDVVWVMGGSVAGLLAMWRLHRVDEAMRTAWLAGVVLTGVSAGSICWHVGGTTDSFGPELRPVTDGLALVPYSNGVHYDSEDQRRPLFQRLISDATLGRLRHRRRRRRAVSRYRLRRGGVGERRCRGVFRGTVHRDGDRHAAAVGARPTARAARGDRPPSR